MAHNKRQLRSLHLFAGAGGGILADLLLGHRPVCAVEIEDCPRRVLLQRQRDGILPMFPIWDDVKTFDGKPWRRSVDIVAGGFPCQDISCAGSGAGLAGERSGLWSEMARIVSEVRPRFVFVENSSLLISRGIDVVLSDLAAMGYDAKWGIVGAHHAGAPHKRDRCWIVADSGYEGLWSCSGGDGCESDEKNRIGGNNQNGSRANVGVAKAGKPQNVEAALADSDSQRCEEQRSGEPVQTHKQRQAEGSATECGSGQARSEPGTRWWATEPCVGGMADGLAAGVDIHGADACDNVERVATGVANRVSRLKAIGNGQCPQAAALAWRLLGGE